MTKTWLYSKVAWAAISSRSNQVFYDRISKIYDEVFKFHKVHAETILKVLNDISSDPQRESLVLDLGCGTGILSRMLDEKGYKVVGMDISFDSLCVLRNHNPRLNLIQAADIQKVLKQITCILSTNGALIVGYFPPAIAGCINVKQNFLGRFMIFLYKVATRKLGYHDRADFFLEEETEKALKNWFKIVTPIASGLNKELLLAQYPATKHMENYDC
jgi:SAM-dependent methyltransferase